MNVLEELFKKGFLFGNVMMRFMRAKMAFHKKILKRLAAAL